MEDLSSWDPKMKLTLCFEMKDTVGVEGNVNVVKNLQDVSQMLKIWYPKAAFLPSQKPHLLRYHYTEDEEKYDGPVLTLLLSGSFSIENISTINELKTYVFDLIKICRLANLLS